MKHGVDFIGWDKKEPIFEFIAKSDSSGSKTLSDGLKHVLVLGDPAVDFLARKLIGEFVNVMRAGGKKELFSDFEEEEMLKRVYEVASKTGPNRSSMLSDILR